MLLELDRPDLLLNGLYGLFVQLGEVDLLMSDINVHHEVLHKILDFLSAFLAPLGTLLNVEGDEALFRAEDVTINLYIGKVHALQVLSPVVR